MKTAVVGLGYWGPNLVRNLTTIDACTSVVVCDLDAERLRTIQRQYPSVDRTTTDFDEIIADPEVAAVVLATPVLTHTDLAGRAIAAGKNVLVEKPLATSGREAAEIVEQARAAGVLVMAGHTFLYSPPVQTVSSLIAAGELGTLLYLQSSRVNLGLHQSDVSVLWDLAPHDLSILLEWLDELPIRVSAFGRSSLPGRPLDVAFVNLEFPSGFVSSLHLSWLAPTKLRRMVLVGAKKMVVYEDTQPEEPVRVYDKGVDAMVPQNFGEYRLTYRTGDVVSPRVAASEPLRAELEDFLGRVARSDPPGRPEERAVQVVSIIEAAERSAAQGSAPVRL